MSQKGDYPSPSGMQGHNNSGPYPGHQDNQNDDLDLQLRHAITNNGAGVGVEHATVPVARDNNNAYTAPLFTPGPPAGYQQVNMASHPLMAAQMHQPQRGQPTSDANKKKSKASRACDECRRKKVSACQSRWNREITDLDALRSSAMLIRRPAMAKPALIADVLMAIMRRLSVNSVALQ